jgi:CubicO group peptidase (beta-lactamase class C family)
VDAKVGNIADTNATLVTKLSRLPLIFQPGTTWEYSYATDVLGRIVEVVSGQSLDKFVAERITGPLKMVDTGYSAPASAAGRATRPQPEGPNKAVPNIPLVTADLAFKSGGGGMVSTAADYARFCQFLLNGGELDGVRIVSRKTIELMAANHLPPPARRSGRTCSGSRRSRRRRRWARASGSATRSVPTSGAIRCPAAWGTTSGAAPTAPTSGWTPRSRCTWC